jgi:hypothetical protein
MACNEPWLRASPALSTAWIAGATAAGSPAALLMFSTISAPGASRRTHPFDYALNRIRRHTSAGADLPANPPPRRFAMLLAAAWAATTAGLFASGRKRAGYISGALLTTAGLTVATTHFCLGSWIYQHLFAASGECVGNDEPLSQTLKLTPNQHISASQATA